MSPNNIIKQFTKDRRIKMITLVVGALLSITSVSLLFLYHLTTPPEDFTAPSALEIKKGMTVRDIARTAKEQHFVRSETLLYAVLTFQYDPTSIFAGTYIFNTVENIFGVAQKLAQNDIENKLIRLTIPEGITIEAIADIAEHTLPDFDKTIYLQLTEGLEGYLFPETYFVPETFTEADLVALQKNTFEEQIAPLTQQIQESPLSLYEVLTLASLVEREARNEESMRMVAGILQNRLAISMPLQADASIEYVLDKPLDELTADDLKIDSPYNTYLNKGLMPSPIGNPGIQAIRAVLKPTPTEYLFYITDDNGNFHYAETFTEHTQNIAKYLR